MDDIFDKYIIVEEKAYSDFSKETSGRCYGCSTKFTDVNQFAGLEFIGHQSNLEIKDIGNIWPKEKVPLAQIIVWKWNNDKGTQEIKDTKTLDKGGCTESNWFYETTSFVVRILQQKREQIDENPSPLPHSSDDEFVIHIGDNQITVSAAWLMALSPVINRMLSTEMKEKQQRSINLDNLGVDMEQFKEFLSAISVIAHYLHSPFFPNPKNVLYLLKMADFFQVDWLKSRCEMHLINCVEIPLIDRFLLIEPYRLDKLKMFFMHLDVNNLRTFFKANHEQIPSKMLREFTSRLCG